MAYKPPEISSFGPRGEATVKLGRDKEGRKVANVTYADGKSYNIPASNCPPYVTKGTFHVSLDSSKRKITNMHPLMDVYEGRVVDFAVRQGEQPAPRTKDMGEWNYQYFIVNIEIVGSRYKGMVTPLFLRYHFGEEMEEIDGNMRSVTGITKPTSRYTKLLTQFLNATGVWDFGPISYSDNVLPEIRKRVLRAKKTFKFMMDEGWIISITASDDEPATASDWDEDSSEEEVFTDVDVVEETSTWGDTPDYEEDSETTEENAPWNEIDEDE